MESELWFFKKNQQGKVQGPLSHEQLEEHWRTGKISATMLLSQDQEQWHTAEQIMAEKMKTMSIGEKMPSLQTIVRATAPKIPSGDSAESPLRRYKVIKELGRGGMGVVYQAMDTKLSRIVAAKMLLDTGADEVNAKRFMREAELNAKLSHPNIVQVYNFGTTPQFYIIMEFVEGCSYNDLLEDKKFPLKKKLELFQQVCDAVEYGHKQKIIHRDLKPQNIMVTEENIAKVMDFGLAKSLTAQEMKLSKTGQTLGTPKYMSPEQADGRKLDHRTDIYSLGIILYKILTGREPYTSENIVTILDQLANEEPILPREINPAIPQKLQAICMKCLEKNRDHRYESARALRDDIQAYFENKPILATKDKIIKATPQKTSSKKTLVGIMIVLAIAAILLGSILYQSEETKNYNTTQHLVAQKQEKEQYNEAIELWKGFLTRFPETSHRQEIEKNIEYLKTNHERMMAERLRQEEEQEYQKIQKLVLREQDQENYTNAIVLWEEYLLRFPNSFHRAEVEEYIKQFKIVKDRQIVEQRRQEEEREYQKARKFVLQKETQENYMEAIELWQRFLTQYPDTSHRTEIEKNIEQCKEKHDQLIARRQAQMNEQQAEQLRLEHEQAYKITQELALDKHNEKKYQEAIEVWQGFLLRFPDTPRRNEIEEHIKNCKKAESQFYRQNEELKKSYGLPLEVWEACSYKYKEERILDLTTNFWKQLPAAQQMEYTKTYQKEYALAKKLALEKTIHIKSLPPSAKPLKMILIPPGRFWMGSPDDEEGHNILWSYKSQEELNTTIGCDLSEGPRHRVVISSPYYISQYECTQAQWKAVMGSNPSRFFNAGPDAPVEQVTWNAIANGKNSFCGRTGLTLPSEAEWEYACRSGALGMSYVGDFEILGVCNAPALSPLAWYGGNSGVSYIGGEDSSSWPDKEQDHKNAGTHPVGQKIPNGFGLYDILGNVYEFCCDNPRIYKTNDEMNPIGTKKLSATFMIRGGSWSRDVRDVRCAFRFSERMNAARDCVGFRPAAPVK